MKKNFLIFLFAFCFLLFSLPVLAFTYSRTPTGLNFTAPVIFTLHYETDEAPFGEGVNWQIFFFLSGYTETEAFDLLYIGSLHNSSELIVADDFIFDNSLFLNGITYYAGSRIYLGGNCEPIIIGHFIGPEGTDCEFWSDYLEQQDNFQIYAPMPTPAPTGYFPSDFASNSFAIVGDLITDLSPAIVLILGIAFVPWIIEFLVGIFEGEKRK